MGDLGALLANGNIDTDHPFAFLADDRIDCNRLDIWGFRNVDMRLRKDLLGLSQQYRIAVTADLFNAFNFTNLGCWEGYKPPLPATNANFGNANCVSSDARRFQAGLSVDF